jgi:hypothetical protein
MYEKRKNNLNTKARKYIYQVNDLRGVLIQRRRFRNSPLFLRPRMTPCRSPKRGRKNMTVTSVSTSTFLSDAIILIRDALNTNISDPLGSRATNEKFVMTSYPLRQVTYPIITIIDKGISDVRRMGMRSELHWVSLPVEIRVWARNVIERDTLFQQVYNYLRGHQFTATASSDTWGLHDFKLTNTLNIDEEGTAGIRSKIIEIEYKLVVGG